MSETLEIVRIAKQHTKAELSKSQKLFNKLIKKIDLERKKIVQWQAAALQYQQKYSSEIVPKIMILNELKMKLVKLLDQNYNDKLFTKRDKSRLSEFICELAVDLVFQNEDEELTEIYNKHSGTDIVDDEADAMKLVMAEMFGIEIDDDLNFTNPEELMEHFFDQMEQAQTKQEEHKQKRKKSPHALKREAKKKLEMQNISQSIREIYRKLASALHPDKAQDQNERDRKTELMTRVNIAYDKKDLLQLLELQLEIEQIDEAAINTLSEDRLKYYNKLLTEQVDDLIREVVHIKSSLSMQFEIMPMYLNTPQNLDRHFELEIKEIKRVIRAVKSDFNLFNDKQNIKQFLRGNF